MTERDIKSYYKKALKESLVYSKDVNANEFSATVFNSALQNVRGRLSVKLQKSKYSDVLHTQLARHLCGLGEVFADRVEYFHASTICDMMECVDKGSVIGEPFYKNPILNGLIKVHHSALSQKSSIISNILTGITSRTLRDLKKANLTEPSQIFNELHSKVIVRKQNDNELTGEWIVYSLHEGRKYFLCLACHYEKDEDILERVSACLSQFPELKEVIVCLNS